MEEKQFDDKMDEALEAARNALSDEERIVIMKNQVKDLPDF